MSDEFAALAEEITRDRMRYYGYTEERLAAAEDVDHQDEGCSYEGFIGWTCVDENESPLHPDRDELERTAEFVVWVMQHPAITHWPTFPAASSEGSAS